MALIGAEFYVEVDGIVVDPEVLGRSVTVSRGEERFRIDFPAGPDAFVISAVSGPFTQSGPPDPREYTPSAAVIEQSDNLATVRIVRVAVNATSALSAEGFASSASGQKDLHDQLLWELREKAVELVDELCARLNLDVDQRWIEPRGKYPRVLNLAGLVDLDASMAFGVMLGSAGSIRVLAAESVLNDASLERVARHLKEGPPAADEMLLVEARHLVEADFPAAPERSVLMAAIGVELRTKRLLRSLARTSDQASALDLLLGHPRDWSMSVHGLFLKALPVFVGAGAAEGLGQGHIDLSKRVQKLFASRNLIAHTGAAVTGAEAVLHVQT
ncbi:MAG: hypothetical protein L6311_08600, partial [Cellulomonas sp.]|nr:hypothetical protein [Cellulomonas sp.]